MHTYVKKTVDACQRNQKALLAVSLVIVMLIALYFMTRSPYEGFNEHGNKNAGEGFAVKGADSANGVEYTTGDVAWDADKEVVVVFHRMATCGPCKAFTPVWQKVSAGLRGKKDKSGRKVQVYVVDQTHPLSEDVGGFPTVRKWISAEEHREFNGPRTEENLASFIMGA